MRYWLVMPAAGSGQRFGSSVPKTYARLAGRTLIEWSLAPFLADERCAGICVALGVEDRWFKQLPVAGHARVRTVTGGAQRADSVAAALAALTDAVAADDWVLVHDAARPCLSSQELEDLLAALPDAREGALLALPLADTLKRTDDGAEVAATPPREGLWRALTPQAFRAGTLARALESAREIGRTPTDEAQAVEWTGGAPRLVKGSALNIKVTQATDLGLAEAILRSRGGASVDLRVGSGYDVHAFTEGDHVMLGGVRIAHDRGVLAHSDGDVLLHALCDALLGAAGLGDIGQHFPDSDPRWKGADSSRFVTAVRELLDQQGFAVRNVDLTLVCEAPRIGVHRAAICEHIAQLLGVAPERVNLKATTTEKLGFEGRREGIAAHATVLIGPR